MAKDLALAANGDLFIDDTGDFEIIDAVRQGIQIRLRWIKGEWVFNTAMGRSYRGREHKLGKGCQEPDATGLFYGNHYRRENTKRGGVISCRIME